MSFADDTRVIPLWINGHAYLTMTSKFLDVSRRQGGKVFRRIPLCGEAEALIAVDAARNALGLWAARSEAVRQGFSVSLGEALSGHADHFARLIVEDTGKALPDAKAEVAGSVALLQKPEGGNASGVLGVVGNDVQPLLGALQQVIPALIAGAVAVIVSSPKAPSVLYALVELSSDCGLPPGVINLLHGDGSAVEGLRAAGVRLVSMP